MENQKLENFQRNKTKLTFKPATTFNGLVLIATNEKGESIILTPSQFGYNMNNFTNWYGCEQLN